MIEALKTQLDMLHMSYYELQVENWKLQDKKPEQAKLVGLEAISNSSSARMKQSHLTRRENLVKEETEQYAHYLALASAQKPDSKSREHCLSAASWWPCAVNQHIELSWGDWRGREAKARFNDLQISAEFHHQSEEGEKLEKELGVKLCRFEEALRCELEATKLGWLCAVAEETCKWEEWEAGWLLWITKLECELWIILNMGRPTATKQEVAAIKLTPLESQGTGLLITWCS